MGPHAPVNPSLCPWLLWVNTEASMDVVCLDLRNVPEEDQRELGSLLVKIGVLIEDRRVIDNGCVRILRHTQRMKRARKVM
jgi:hypothetical protein